MENQAGRYMAFDYGNKRIGVAVTDPLQIFATALDTIHPNSIIEFIQTYIQKENTIGFIVGKPLQMNNEPSEISPHVEGFIRSLKKNFPNIPIYRIDERFTSIMASRTILEMGIKKMKRQEKAPVDRISATLILQSFLENKSRYI